MGAKENLKLFEIPPTPKPPKVLQARKKVTSFNNRRYKLHYKIKSICDLRAKQRTIIIFYDGQINNKYIAELQTRFQYNIQTEIFVVNDIEVIEPQFLN